MKQLCLLFLSFSLLHYASAQTVIPKQIIAGGSSDDEVTAGIIRTTDGGFLAAGYSGSLPGTYKKAVNYGDDDYWIVKYDKSGKKQYDKAFGGTGYDVMYAVIQTADGGYALGGSSSSGVSGNKTAAGKGSSDMWLVKTDSLGNKLWDITYGGSDSEVLNSIAQTKDGGYILCGSSFSNISGDKTENGFGRGDFWVVKITASGSVQWNKTFGGNKYDIATNVAQTSDGGYFIAGRSASGLTGNKTTDGRGSDDIWIVKTDSLGNKLWDETIGGKALDETVTMERTTDGGFVIGTYSGSGISGDKTEAGKGGVDYWLVKVTEAGVIQWQKVLGGNNSDFLTGIKQTSDGGYIVAGSSNSDISGNKTESRRGVGSDNWIVKLSADRTIEWDKTIGGSDEDGGGVNNILALTSNQYLVASPSDSPVSDDKTVPNLGSFDIWIASIKYNSLAFDDKASIAPLSSLSAASSFTVAPNPVRNVMQVQTAGKATITLSNGEGKVVLTKTINNRENILVSGLPAGTYYVKNITTGEVKKILIVK